MALADELRGMIGTELGVSEWYSVTQKTIDDFADVTGDHQWIHVDREKSAAGPFGTTIAHGFLTLSLLPRLNPGKWLDRPDVLGGLNYGIDKLRFLTPVKRDARVRLRVKMLAVEEKGAGRTLITNESTMEIEGEAKPAFVAQTLVMVLSKP